MRLGTSNLFCKLRTHHVEAAQEEWTERWGMEIIIQGYWRLHEHKKSSECSWKKKIPLGSGSPWAELRAVLGGVSLLRVKCCIQYQENHWSEAVQLNRFTLTHCCVSSQNFAWLQMIEFIKLHCKIHTPFLISFPAAVPAQSEDHC